MASRNRHRQIVVKDGADEEQSLWSQLQLEAKKVDLIIAAHNQKWDRMNEIKTTLEALHAAGDLTSGKLEDELMKLCRENLKLIEESTAILEGPSENEPNSLLGSISILKALRQSSENDAHPPPPARNINTKQARNAKRKATAVDTSSNISAEDRDAIMLDASTPISSTKGSGPPSNRLKVNTSSRAGSAAPLSGREASVKIEEGVESGAEQVFKGEGKGRRSFALGTEVVYRYKKASHSRGSVMGDDQEGEGILCTITSIIGEGKGRRYEIIDVDPEGGASPYRATASQLVAIPSSNDDLPDPSIKKTVLALYPGTTTFYRAEVTAVKGRDVVSGHVKLRFEDEDEKNKENLVERRYVLLEWPGK